MKTLPQLISQELTQAIGYTLLHSLWQGVLIALSLSVLLYFLHRQTAVIRYRAALGSLLLQLVCSGLTFTYYYRAAHSAGQVMSNANLQASFFLEPMNQNPSYLSWTSISLFFQEQLPLIVTVWLLGLSFMLLRFVGGLGYLQRLRNYRSTPFPAQWQHKLQTLSTHLKLTNPVTGAESALVKTPLVIGYFKPLILLPIGTLSNLPLNQVEAILAHELAHIRRHDYLINILQTLTEALFFYHPAIWWVSDFVRIERENCCDDQAIAVCGNKVAYAQALTHLEEMKQYAPGLALALAGKDGSLLGRIKRLFEPHAIKPNPTEGFLVATLMVFCFLTISAAALAHYSTKKQVITTNVRSEVPVKNTVGLKYNPSNTASLSDSTAKKKEVILMQDDEGKLLSLTIDGKRVPQDQLYKYESYNLKGAVVGNSVLGGNTTLKGKIIINKGENIAPDAPQKVNVLPAPAMPAINVAPVNPPVPNAPAAPATKPAGVIRNSLANPTVVANNTAKTVIAEAKPGTSDVVKIKYTGSENTPDPLYILDGTPIDKTAMNGLNPNTIQKVEVLKGGHATTYGDAGKNGVIIITTKTGSADTRIIKSDGESNNVLQVNESVNETVTINQNLLPVPIAAEINTAGANVHSRDHEAKPKSILSELKQDNLYSDDKDYMLRITNTGMYLNNVKQPDALFQKYRKYLPYPDKNVTNQVFEVKGRFREK